MNRYGIILTLCMALLLAGGPVAAEPLGDYVSVSACIACHEEIVDGWKTTPHADAFATLKKQGEEKQEIPGCFKCHVTGFGQDGGFIDMAMTPDLINVQCESCHGPGRMHVEAGGDPSKIVLASPDIGNCRTCHTEGQDKNFDFPLKKQYVHGGGPRLDRTASKQAEGRLWASAKKIDFGTMVEGLVAIKTVQLKNTGDTPVKISNVTTS